MTIELAAAAVAAVRVAADVRERFVPLARARCKNDRAARKRGRITPRARARTPRQQRRRRRRAAACKECARAHARDSSAIARARSGCKRVSASQDAIEQTTTRTTTRAAAVERVRRLRSPSTLLRRPHSPASSQPAHARARARHLPSRRPRQQHEHALALCRSAFRLTRALRSKLSARCNGQRSLVATTTTRVRVNQRQSLFALAWLVRKGSKRAN